MAPRKYISSLPSYPHISVQEKNIPSDNREAISNYKFLLNEEIPLPSKVQNKGFIYPHTYLFNTPLRITTGKKQPREPILKRYAPNLRVTPKGCLKL